MIGTIFLSLAIYNKSIIIKEGAFIMSKDLETINKSLDDIYQKLLELCKMMGINIKELEKKVDERYAKAV